MLIANGLKCTSCFYIDDDVLYDDNEGIPECPHCGGDRQVDWSHGRAPYGKGGGYGNFVPVDMGVLGKCETKEQYDRACATIKERFPGHSILVEGDSSSDRQLRADEARHRSWLRKRQNGVDDQVFNEISAAKKRLKAEGQTKHDIVTKNPLQLTGNAGLNN